MPSFLFVSLLQIPLIQLRRQLNVVKRLLFRFLTVVIHDLFLLIQFSEELLLVVALSELNSVASVVIFLFRLLDKVFGRFFDLKPVHLLLLELNFALICNMNHLVLEIILDLLVFAELDHLVSFSLHFVLPRIFVDHLAPKLVLLFLYSLNSVNNDLGNLHQ